MERSGEVVTKVTAGVEFSKLRESVENGGNHGPGYPGKHPMRICQLATATEPDKTPLVVTLSVGFQPGHGCLALFFFEGAMKI